MEETWNNHQSTSSLDNYFSCLETENYKIQSQDHHPAVRHGVGNIMLWAFIALRGRWMGPDTLRSWSRTSFPQPEHIWHHEPKHSQGNKSSGSRSNTLARPHHDLNLQTLILKHICGGSRTMELLKLRNIQGLERICKRSDPKSSLRFYSNPFTNNKKGLISELDSSTKSRFAWGSKTYFTPSNTNEFLAFIYCLFLWT